jgi:F0F1-type ATP synthase assembly protein I
VLPERRAIDPDVKKMWRGVGLAGSVAIEVTAAICIGYFLGDYLDRKLGTRPWLMYLFLAGGISAAIQALRKLIRDYNKFLEQDDKPKPKN